MAQRIEVLRKVGWIMLQNALSSTGVVVLTFILEELIAQSPDATHDQSTREIAVLWNQLGLLQYQSDHIQVALGAFSNATTNDASYAQAQNNRAVIEFITEDDSAISRMRNAILRDEDNGIYRSNLRVMSHDACIEPIHRQSASTQPFQIAQAEDVLVLSPNVLILMQHLRISGGGSVNEVLKNVYCNHYYDVTPNENEKPLIDDLIAMPSEHRSRIQMCYVHCLVNLHPVVPCYSITMVRDPVKRWVSSYYRQKETGGIDHSLTTFMDEIIGEQAANQFSRWIASTNGDSFVYQTGPEHSVNKLYDEAIVKNYLFVGICEYFEESLFILALKLGWSFIPGWRVHFKSNRPAISELPKATIQKIEDMVTVDRNLYDFCLRRLQQELATLSLRENQALASYKHFQSRAPDESERFSMAQHLFQ